MSRLTILLLRAYQAVLSPMFAALGSQCRFEPSCSQY
ncbi:MAG: membrane protein insertion efficiency factor YidD, partial [Chloroflexi bacterium]|nr:membrane protein insertion efficiency factor YidD [Chloroflexota bacterium]